MDYLVMLPIYGRFVGDFGVHLVAVDTEDTVAEVGRKVAAHAVGRRLPAKPSGSYEVLIDGRVIPDEVCLGQLSLRPLQWIDVRWKP